MRVSVVIPALNEIGCIRQLVLEARHQPVLEVIVVDNGSTDGTGAAASDAGGRTILEPQRGYGHACAAGAAAASGDIIVFLDGDFSFSPAEIPLLLAPLAENRADLVLGSRVLGGIERGAMAPHQRWGNRVCTGVMSRLYGVALTDLGPFRAIRADVLRGLGLREMTFGWPTEMIVKALRRGVRLVEVPVTCHPRRTGKSKVSGTARGSVLAGWHILGVTLKYATPRH